MSTETLSLLNNLGLGTLMCVLTVLTHFWGLVMLTYLMGLSRHHLRPHEGRVRQALVLLLVILGLFALHTIEIWGYALAYYLLDEFGSFEAALYFSTSAFTTVGFGDLVMTPQWRMLSAIESANGWILFGWSTAFMLTVTTRLKLLEHEWLESGQ